MTLDLGTADQLRSALATVAAIPVTPFGPDGQADWDAHDRVIRRMVDAGVRLVTPNGNTGEFYASDHTRVAVDVALLHLQIGDVNHLARLLGARKRKARTRMSDDANFQPVAIFGRNAVRRSHQKAVVLAEP